MCGSPDGSWMVLRWVSSNCVCVIMELVSSVCTAIDKRDYRNYSHHLAETLQKNTSSDFRAPLRFSVALIHDLQRCCNSSLATSPDDQSSAVVGILELYETDDKLWAISVPSPSAHIRNSLFQIGRTHCCRVL